jgi:hypothetical protein
LIKEKAIGEEDDTGGNSDSGMGMGNLGKKKERTTFFEKPNEKEEIEVRKT